MAHSVTAVEPGSIAAQCGIQPGDMLIRINGEPILDQIDYQFLTATEKLVIEVSRQEDVWELQLEKDEMEPLGLTLSSSLMSKPHACANHCVFCFIDQMPPGMRTSLYVKDDDWRLSLMMGNYITLTNLSDQERHRMILRHASPLYISVHATNGAVRAQMMGNPKADRILDHLRQFRDNHIQFHCQVVLCPGLNDGAVLDQTLADLSSFVPSTRSIALVPVGVTAHRKGLCPLQPYTKQGAAQVLAQAHAWQQAFLQKWNTRLVFPADEFYCLAGVALPPAESYECYPQIENGVGLLRRFETEYFAACKWMDPAESIPRRVLIATGALAAPFLSTMIRQKPVDGVDVRVEPVANHFFGESVTVSGLVTGRDLLNTLQGIQTDEVLIPDVMLRQEDNLFLDDMPLSALQDALPIPVHVVDTDGAALLYALQGELFGKEK